MAAPNNPQALRDALVQANWPRYTKPKRGKPRTVLRFKGRSVKRRMHDVGVAMRQRPPGLDLKKLIANHMKLIEQRGGTLEGYMLHYKPQTLTHFVKIRKLWEIDQDYQQRLTMAGLTEHCGHTGCDAEVMLRNRAFFARATTGDDDGGE